MHALVLIKFCLVVLEAAFPFDTIHILSPDTTGERTWIVYSGQELPLIDYFPNGLEDIIIVRLVGNLGNDL